MRGVRWDALGTLGGEDVDGKVRETILDGVADAIVVDERSILDVAHELGDSVDIVLTLGPTAVVVGGSELDWTFVGHERLLDVLP